MTVEIVDSVDDYLVLMREIFDFEVMRTFLRKRGDGFKVLVDAMNGGMRVVVVLLLLCHLLL